MAEKEEELFVSSRQMQETNTSAFYITKAESFQSMCRNGIVGY